MIWDMQDVFANYYLCPSVFCRCRSCHAETIRRVHAKCAEIEARHAAQWAQEEAAEWQTALGSAKLREARHEAASSLSGIRTLRPLAPTVRPPRRVG